MFNLIDGFLKNIVCSNCTEHEFEETYLKENYKSWKLYLKEYELYSTMILYNEKLEKDISYLINKNDTIILLNDKEIYIKLEYISNNSDGTAILVPTDEYQEVYEKIESMEKNLDIKINAHYIGTFDIKKSNK